MRKEYIIGIVIVILLGIGVAVLLSSPQNDSSLSDGSGLQKGISYKEIANPSGFVNTNDAPVKIADYVGKKVILLDVMTYSCINCQRTFPYMTSWYERYKNDGLIVIGIHTPEFAFEKDRKNVERAMKEFGINFPVVLDNDYGTWNAYGNRYWPRKYLIDIHGNIVYDHIGEGAYEETEMKIKELLAERAQVLGEDNMLNEDNTLVSKTVPDQIIAARSPETYFGSSRNEYFKNGTSGRAGEQTLVAPKVILSNSLYLGGTWNINNEYAESIKDSRVIYRYNAKEVYVVASANEPVEIEVWQDGKLVTTEAGADVSDDGITRVKESRLYKLVRNSDPSEHLLELRVKDGSVLLFAFTFG